MNTGSFLLQRNNVDVLHEPAFLILILASLKAQKASPIGQHFTKERSLQLPGENMPEIGKPSGVIAFWAFFGYPPLLEQADFQNRRMCQRGICGVTPSIDGNGYASPELTLLGFSCAVT